VRDRYSNCWFCETSKGMRSVRLALQHAATFSLCLVHVLCARLSRADAPVQAGGDLTSDLQREVLLELPAPAIRSGDAFDLHLQGHALFHKSFRNVTVNGRRVLGPRFNNDSCGSCHVRVGRGPLQLGDTSSGSAVIIKVGLKRKFRAHSSPSVPGFGEQLRDHALSGQPRLTIRLRWKSVHGQYPDGTPYSLRRPEVSFSLPGYRARDLMTSIRMTPALVGMGLLDAIPSERILALADPEDSNGDGISGKVQYSRNRETGNLVIGRFGFRATQPTLRQQTAAALFHDMGITTELFQNKGHAPELSTPNLLALLFYQQLSGVPRQQLGNDPTVIRGEQLFTAIGCAACHVPTQYSSPDASSPYLRSQTFRPFTDLLLHDMGTGLADTRPELLATGREWRTSPLWGLGLSEVISPRNTGFLHDGRARSIEEAILWHAGEALVARDRFVTLPKQGRLDLIQFLRSL
jgi:CxxC motif-containing protein (DUF1111 family)